jgi:hypothetical protein
LCFLPDGVRLLIIVKKELPEDVKEFFRREGSKGGKKGGKSRMEQLTPEQRTALAKKAATARWGEKDTPQKPRTKKNGK